MRLALLVLAAVAPACIDLPEPNQFGAHVIVAADPGHELCGGSLAHMDEFVAALSAEFSLAPPTGDDRFIFYWLDAEQFHERTACHRESTACAYLGASYTPYAPINHELVHNVAEEFGYPRALFVEGLAVAFEGLATDVAVDAPRSTVRVHDLLGLTTGVQLIRVGGYPTAGAFTSHLIHTHGLDAYLRMYEAVGPLESERGIDTIFREEFGVSLADSIDVFEDSGVRCGQLERDAKLLECAAPELEWDGDRLVHHRSLACDQDDVVGPYHDESVVVFHTVTIPEGGNHIITVLGDDPRNKVSLQPCTICDGEGVTVERDASPRTLALAPGRHSLRLHGPADLRTSLGIRIERVEPPGAAP